MTLHFCPAINESLCWIESWTRTALVAVTTMLVLGGSPGSTWAIVTEQSGISAMTTVHAFCASVKIEERGARRAERDAPLARLERHPGDAGCRGGGGGVAADV